MQPPIYEIIAGSHLYGTARPDSDYDYRGVRLETAEELFGFRTFEQEQTEEPDRVIYSLKKFMKLAMDNNPNILDILFAKTAQTIHRSPAWEHIYNVRHAFLSKRVRHTYLGYARSALRRLQAGGSPSKPKRQHFIDTYGYDVKDASHIMRLLFQLHTILYVGWFDPTLHDEELDDVRAILHGEWELEKFVMITNWKMDYLSKFEDDLPEKPDYKLLQKVQMLIYAEHFGIENIFSEG